jgi:hypothetical protein
MTYAVAQVPSWSPLVVHAAVGGGQPAVMQVLAGPQTIPPVQSAFVRHCTQVVPLHFGVAPPHGTQLGPQYCAVLHAWQVLDASQ